MEYSNIGTCIFLGSIIVCVVLFVAFILSEIVSNRDAEHKRKRLVRFCTEMERDYLLLFSKENNLSAVHVTSYFERMGIEKLELEYVKLEKKLIEINKSNKGTRQMKQYNGKNIVPMGDNDDFIDAHGRTVIVVNGNNIHRHITMTRYIHNGGVPIVSIPNLPFFNFDPAFYRYETEEEATNRINEKLPMFKVGDKVTYNGNQFEVRGIKRGKINEYSVVNLSGLRHLWDALETELSPVLYRRMTNRELCKWLAKGNGEWTHLSNSLIYSAQYEKDRENLPVVDKVRIRSWDETEWREPMIEVTK